MKQLLKTFLVAGVLFLLPIMLMAQEKTQAYYNRHETEILPDARVAFQRGEYERTVELCKWHYIIVGDRAAEPLRNKAERCAQLSKEMAELQANDDLKAAKDKANAILALNPDDAAAKAVLQTKEPVSEVEVIEPLVETIEPAPVEPVPVEQEAEQKEEPVVESAQPQPVVEQTMNEPVKATQPQQDNPRTRFVIKGGASLLDLQQLTQTIAPSGALGVYDIGGSIIGSEVGAYVCPGLSSSAVSLFGIDASLVIRAARGFYPKVGAGYFSCKSTAGDGNQTKGLCANAGLTFLLGQHFCFEIGAKYYPAVKIQGTERASIKGVSYDFPSSKTILPGGFCPALGIGLAF